MRFGTSLTPNWFRMINSWRRYSARQQRVREEKSEIETRARIRAQAICEENELKQKLAILRTLDLQDETRKEQAACQLARTVFEVRASGIQ